MEKVEFNEKMKEVAELLGMTWEDREESWDNRGVFSNPNDLDKKLALSNDGYRAKGRIEISGLYPLDGQGKHFPQHGYKLEITVAETKTAEEIARDIRRRVLPAYLKNLAIIKEQIARADKYHNDRMAKIRQVADHFGWELQGQDKDVIYPDVPGIYQIEALNDTKVKFRVECSPDTAIRIINIVKEDNP